MKLDAARKALGLKHDTQIVDLLGIRSTNAVKWRRDHDGEIPPRHSAKLVVNSRHLGKLTGTRADVAAWKARIKELEAERDTLSTAVSLSAR